MKSTKRFFIAAAACTLLGTALFGCKGTGVTLNRSQEGPVGSENLVTKVSLSFASVGSTVSESAGPTQALIAFDRPAPSDFAIHLQYGGTASSNDYLAQSGVTLNVAKGANSALVTIIPIADTLFEGDETVVMTVLPNPLYNVRPGGSSHTMTITELSGVPTLTVNQPTRSINEGAGQIDVTASLDFASASPIVVDISISPSSTAQMGDDFSLDSPQEVINAGSTEVTFSIQINDDPDVEIDETIVFNLAVSAGAFSGGSGVITVLDDDQPRAVSIASQQVTEGGNVSFNVNLDQAPTETTVINIINDGSTASPGEYSVQPSTVTFNPGQTSKVVTVTSHQDSLFESTEYIRLALSAATSNVLVSPTASDHDITVNDDDSVLANFRVVSGSRYENGSNQTVFVDLSQNAPESVTFGLQYLPSSTASNGTDAQAPTSFTILQGTNSGSFVIDPIDDLNVEGNETYILRLTSNQPNFVVGSSRDYTFTIIDDDQPPAPVLQVASASRNRSVNENAGSIQLQVELNAPSSGITTAVVGVVGGTATPGGTDYSINSSILIPDGATTGNLLMNINNDFINEGNETYQLKLLSVNNGAVINTSQDLFQGTIVDDDLTPISIDASVRSVNEGDSYDLTATLSQPAISRIRVSFIFNGSASTATLASDFVLPTVRELVFEVNESIATVTIPTIEDLSREGNESIVLALSSVLEGRGRINQNANSIVVTLVDDDTGVEDPVVSDTGEIETGGDSSAPESED